MYYYYQINYERPNNINKHVHVGRKIVEHLEINKNDQFSKITYRTQTKKKFNL
jgi:hypothetical protein